ncbi:MAG: PD-(D/E)XK nuclease family transposase, partial [Lachnospiraceae bacterium]
SLKEEGSKASIYSKKTILDILARLSNHGLCDFEMQVTAQEFIVQRMDVYASDLMMMQYSIRKGEKKKEFQFSDMADTYCVVFMKHSPNIFKDHTSFIHYKQEITDTGITLKSFIHIVYIELDKCLEQVTNNTYPKEQEELCFWLVLMADINSDTAKKVLKENPEMAEIYLELGTMSKDREEMAEMLLEKYDETVRYSELNQAKNEGKAEGKAEDIIEILEEYGTVPESVRNAIFSQPDLCVLKKWLKIAAKIDSIEKFIKQM